MQFHLEDPSTDRKLSLCTLTKDVKPIVMKKSEFQYGVVSNLVYWFFALGGMQRKEQNRLFFIE